MPNKIRLKMASLFDMLVYRLPVARRPICPRTNYITITGAALPPRPEGGSFAPTI